VYFITISVIFSYIVTTWFNIPWENHLVLVNFLTNSSTPMMRWVADYT